MADDTEAVPLFDPTMKKKKKKKKRLDDDEGAAKAADQAAPAGDAAATTTSGDSGDADKSTGDGATDAANDAAAGGGGDADDGDGEQQVAPSFGKKKKKKKVGFDPTLAAAAAAGDDGADASEAAAAAAAAGTEDGDERGDDENDDSEKPSWLGTDREYTYTELLTRIFKILDENNPELVRTKRSKMIIKPPTVFREGTKKTVWANFSDICTAMNRQQDHVLAYALAELGTSISVDGNNRLVIKGRFNPKQIESVIKHYIGDYVMCRTCRSHETHLKKENRLYFVNCVSCGSTRSVAAIKTGFQAQIGKRKRM